MSIDLKGMTLPELKKLGKRVERAIASHDKRRKKDAMQAVEKVAKEFGLSIKDLIGGKGENAGKPKKAKKAKAKAKPAYRNPEDASQTWTGKGRKPNWFIAAIDAGKSADDLKI